MSDVPGRINSGPADRVYIMGAYSPLSVSGTVTSELSTESELSLARVSAALSPQTYYVGTPTASGATQLIAAGTETWVVDYLTVQPSPAAAVTVLITSGSTTIWKLTFDATNVLAFTGSLRLQGEDVGNLAINLSTAGDVDVLIAAHQEVLA